jgi:uncharacterized membrane protein
VKALTNTEFRERREQKYACMIHTTLLLKQKNLFIAELLLLLAELLLFIAPMVSLVNIVFVLLFLFACFFDLCFHRYNLHFHESYLFINF